MDGIRREGFIWLEEFTSPPDLVQVFSRRPISHVEAPTETCNPFELNYFLSFFFFLFTYASFSFPVLAAVPLISELLKHLE